MVMPQVRGGENLLDQPVVLFGSEGELGAIASNFSDNLWLLASNNGSLEAIAYADNERPDNALFLAFANTHASRTRKTVTEIVVDAQSYFPDLEQRIRDLVADAERVILNNQFIVN